MPGILPHTTMAYPPPVSRERVVDQLALQIHACRCALSGTWASRKATVNEVSRYQQMARFVLKALDGLSPAAARLEAAQGVQAFLAEHQINVDTSLALGVAAVAINMYEGQLDGTSRATEEYSA